MSDDVKINRGLIGVYFDRSAISHIDGSKGELSYRGYSIHDLATQSTFEEVCYLLLNGELPSASELATFDAALKAARSLPPAILDILTACKDGHPMDALRTAVSALATLEPQSQDASLDGFMTNAIRLTAQVPMIIAAHHALRQGRRPTAPDLTLSLSLIHI